MVSDKDAGKRALTFNVKPAFGRKEHFGQFCQAV